MPTPTIHSDALAQKLADSGLRNTPQREFVYDALLTKRDHPTADEVYARVKTQLPVNFERAPTRYCPHLHPHAHFHDETSGVTRDIELPENLLTEIKAVLPPGYTADAIEITFRGKLPA